MVTTRLPNRFETQVRYFFFYFLYSLLTFKINLIYASRALGPIGSPHHLPRTQRRPAEATNDNGKACIIFFSFSLPLLNNYLYVGHLRPSVRQHAQPGTQQSLRLGPNNGILSFWPCKFFFFLLKTTNFSFFLLRLHLRSSHDYLQVSTHGIT